MPEFFREEEGTKRVVCVYVPATTNKYMMKNM